MIKRILFTILAIATYMMGTNIISRYYAVYQAETAAGQLTNNTQTVAQAQLIVSHNWPLIIANIILFALLLALWAPFIWQLVRQQQKSHHMSKWTMLALALVLTTAVGCKPYGATQIVEIKPNETAFLVPLIGDGTAQDRLQSVDFLEQKQVAAKQVEIPVREHKIGRGWWQIEWVPAVAVIIVDRTPVTREWTSANSTGTSTTNQAFGVESQESIDFKVGATCSALVSEENAAKFLYYFSGKSLAQVMDENIRGFVQAELFNEFGSRTLVEGRQDKKEIFEAVFKRTVAKFEPLGITITSLGGSEGLIYSDPKIQQVINDNFAAQQAQIQAEAQATAQAVENRTIIEQSNAAAQAQATAQAVENTSLIDQASAAATATVVAGQAAADVLRANGETLANYPGLTDYELARRSQGQVPSTLIINGNESSNLPFAFLLQSDIGPTAAPSPPPPTATPSP